VGHGGQRKVIRESISREMGTVVIYFSTRIQRMMIREFMRPKVGFILEKYCRFVVKKRMIRECV
jgi:hypothetical protein